MDYEKLLATDKIEKVVSKELNLTLAERDLNVAKNSFKSSNLTIYDEAGVVSKETAEETLNKAKEFVHIIRTNVHKNRTEK